jgi:hypothetical protein
MPSFIGMLLSFDTINYTLSTAAAQHGAAGRPILTLHNNEIPRRLGGKQALHQYYIFDRLVFPHLLAQRPGSPGAFRARTKPCANTLKKPPQSRKRLDAKPAQA